MDTKVSGSVVVQRNAGNIPEALVSFFDKVKPTISHTAETSRISFLRFKTDKEKGIKRENMAVCVPMFDPDNFTSKPDHEFMQSLVNDYHDSIMVRCANGEINWADATSQDWMVKDYFDTSRDSSGRKVTKEIIAAWYDRTVAATVELRTKTKNAQMTPERVANVISGFKSMFMQFTKYDLVNAFTEPQITLLLTLMAGTVFEETDEIAEYILTKLNKIQELKTAQNELVDAI